MFLLMIKVDKNRVNTLQYFVYFVFYFVLRNFFSCIAIHDLPKQIQLALKKTKFLLYV